MLLLYTQDKQQMVYMDNSIVGDVCYGPMIKYI